MTTVPRVFSIAAAVLIGGLLTACRRAPDTGTHAAEAPTTPIVCTVNDPLRYFAERIGGEHVDVRFPAPADGDPAFWRPDADAIASFQRADLILRNGAGYAKWIERAALPRSRMIDTSAAFADRLIEVTAPTTHTHGPAGEHAHTGTAFTTWIDFEQAIAQARAAHDALATLRPAHADAFAANFAALESDLRELDERMQAIGRALDGAPLVASHPIYQYWARRYGLNTASVQWEPEVVPDDAAMAGLADVLADHPATIMIWEATPDPRSIDRLDAIGVRSVVFDPCATAPAAGDFLTVMRDNVAGLERIQVP